MIVPENEQERRIISSEIFRKGADFNALGEGHPEGKVIAHIEQILGCIDQLPDWTKYRQDLRILALLHDLGKHKVIYNEKGGIIGRSHSVHSEEIARTFVDDDAMLYAIRIHDKYWGFYKDYERGKLRIPKFVGIFEVANLDLLIRFNYADSNNRSKDSIVWFEDKCVELNLRREKVYILEPGVLNE